MPRAPSTSSCRCGCDDGAPAAALPPDRRWRKLRTESRHSRHRLLMPAARIRRLTLSNFRSYRAASLQVGDGPVVLIGANGAGKTNLIEAISFLAPGRGLRRA